MSDNLLSSYEVEIENVAGKVSFSPDAVKALEGYERADIDGVMVKVSRRAIEEVLPVLRLLVAGANSSSHVGD